VVPATALKIRLIKVPVLILEAALIVKDKGSKAAGSRTGKVSVPLIIVIPALLQVKVTVPGGAGITPVFTI